MSKPKIKFVHCRYPKCHFLHETTELKKDDAVQVGSKNSYYHPDCYHTMKTVMEIKDVFCRDVNTTLTGSQVGQLVSIVNNMVFSKHIDVDYILFALNWFIKNKPNSLKYPGGISYIVQNRDVEAAWKKEQSRKLAEKINNEKTLLESTTSNTMLDLTPSFTYTPQKNRTFADILVGGE